MFRLAVCVCATASEVLRVVRTAGSQVKESHQAEWIHTRLGCQPMASQELVSQVSLRKVTRS